MNDNSHEDCLHCVLTESIRDFAKERGSLDGAAVIDHVATVLCEFIAAGAERTDRRRMIKHIQDIIPKRVKQARDEGRYPGGYQHPVGRTP